MRTVLIVLFDGVQSLDVTGPLEVFAGANRWQSGRDHSPAGPNGPDGPAYQIRTASLGGHPVRTQFSTQLAAQLADREPLREVQRWIADHPAADLSVETLASRASLSPRQFARAFAAEVGMPPGRYVDRVRLETARRRMEDTADGVAETARRCGYGTPEAMRRAFVRALGVSPAEYRRRFRPVPAHPAGESCRS